MKRVVILLAFAVVGISARSFDPREVSEVIIPAPADEQPGVTVNIYTGTTGAGGIARPPRSI